MAICHRFSLQQVDPPIDSKDNTTIESVFDIRGYLISANDMPASFAIQGLDTSAPETWEYRYDMDGDLRKPRVTGPGGYGRLRPERCTGFSRATRV
jgi:hypothetical protein